MAGYFELVPDRDGSCTVLLLDKDGNELAASIPFTSTTAAVAAIDSFRTIAASAHIRDHTATAP